MNYIYRARIDFTVVTAKRKGLSKMSSEQFLQSYAPTGTCVARIGGGYFAEQTFMDGVKP